MCLHHQHVNPDPVIALTKREVERYAGGVEIVLVLVVVVLIVLVLIIVVVRNRVVTLIFGSVRRERATRHAGEPRGRGHTSDSVVRAAAVLVSGHAGCPSARGVAFATERRGRQSRERRRRAPRDGYQTRDSSADAVTAGNPEPRRTRANGQRARHTRHASRHTRDEPVGPDRVRGLRGCD